jgi:hypothetical protein
VVGFTCHIGDRTIVGEVKEKEKARAVFKEAVARGETAGLFEQLPEASDVFTTTVGNIPPGAKVIIKITYLGELKHDMEVDGIRYTIPNVICPRYGNYPGGLRSSTATDSLGSGISITVDAEMADGSFIQKIQSPSHPISMTMGTTSIAPNGEPTMTKASATLTLGTAQLDTDFVVQIVSKNTGVPKAVLETHPTIPNHRALMATLVPKFALPAEKPELVFVCDRSGSMSGSRMTLVIQALKVFLKSLPVGVKFNICSFGSSYSFLWPKSVTYSQQTLDEAIRHADGFSANYGGTEILTPLKGTIDQRYKDMPLDVMLLTDGEIWNQSALFTYLNQSVSESKAPIRLFTLGIGNGVSHALIEGVARAGNGFSQTVGEGEKMDTKVVRMLKGALSPHVNDYTLEVKYSHNVTRADDDDDFEIVEKVADSLKVKLDLGEAKEAKTVSGHCMSNHLQLAKNHQKNPISLFDTSADPDKEEPPAYDETGEERYAHLPKIPVPKIIQAPQSIPSLFAFNRTNAYLLLGPEAPKATPKSVVLRGTSSHGPLELEIPIQILEQPGESIHQLAAKKAISELEQGRGWLPEAKDESGTLIKSKFEGRFSDMVEREAVRLGVQFQVGGKWCSFVAVESNKQAKPKEETDREGWEWLEDENQSNTTKANSESSTFSSFLHSATFLRPSPSPSLLKMDFHSDTGDLEEEESSDDSSDSDGAGQNRFSRGADSNTKSGGGATVAAATLTNLDGSQSAILRLQQLGKAMGEEVDRQNAHISRIVAKTGAVDMDMVYSTKARQRLDRITDNNTTGPGKRPEHRVQRMRKASATPQPAMASEKFSAPAQSIFASNLERGERLDSLAQRTGDLSSQAKLFHSQANLKKSSGLFGGLFGSRSAAPAPAPQSSNISKPAGNWTGGAALFGSSRASSSFGSNSTVSAKPATFSSPAPARSSGLFGSAAPPSGGFGSAPGAPPGASPLSSFGAAPSPAAAPTSNAQALQDYQMGLMTLRQDNPKRRMMTANPEMQAPISSASAPPMPPPPPFMSYGAPPPASAAGPPPPLPGAQTFGHGAPSGYSMQYSTAASPTDFGSDSAALESFDFDSFLHTDNDVIMNTATPDIPAVSPQYSPTSPGFSPVSGSNTPTSGPPGTSSFFAAGKLFAAAAPAATAPLTKTPEDLSTYLISLQTFEGSWEVSPALLIALQIQDVTVKEACAKAAVDAKVFLTALVIAVFERKLRASEGSWELVVDKAKGWLEGQGVGDVEVLVGKATLLVK